MNRAPMPSFNGGRPPPPQQGQQQPHMFQQGVNVQQFHRANGSYYFVRLNILR